MQLRSFEFYTNTAPKVISSQPCDLVDLDGSVAAAGWFQVFDLAAAPSNGAVPLKSFDVLAAGPLPSLFQTLGPVSLLNGLVVAMSSTEATYTAVATNYDVYGELAEWEMPIPGLTTIGDLTTGLQVQQVWPESSGGTNTVFQITAVNQTSGPGVTLYAVVFATDGMNIATDKYYTILKLPPNSTQKFTFGDSGLQPLQLNNADNSLHQGCSIRILDTLSPPHAYGSASVAIQTLYKSVTNF